MPHVEGAELKTGAQIRAGRALLGWRRDDLAAAAGLHRNAIAYWEWHDKLPRKEPSTCARIRKAFHDAGVTVVNAPAPGVCLITAGQRAAA
jgi:DNA-binding XRE family transcriptional regulator